MNNNQKRSKRWIYLFLVIFTLAAAAAVFFKKESDRKNKNDSATVLEEKENQTIKPTSDVNQDDSRNQREESKTVDYKTLGIKEYTYPSEFSMEEDLKTAISVLAVSYPEFNQNVVQSDDWKDTFITHFIQNSRISFDYLDQIAEQNKGEIGIDELNYIQYSLTGIELDLTSAVNGSVNHNDSSSFMRYGSIKEYQYEHTDQGVRVTALLGVETDGTDAVSNYELVVELVKNPYSCFDGYSIHSISSKEVESKQQKDDLHHIFYGTDMMEEDGVFTFECTESGDELNYAHFVSVNLKEAEELAKIVREHAGGDFKVTYVLRGDESNPIDAVVPIDITLIE